jgi:hypothetical protein
MRNFNRRMNFLMAILFTALVACSQPAEDIEFVKPTPEISDTSLYLSQIRSEYPELEGVSDTTLVDFGKNSCAMFDAGYTIEDIFDIANDSGLDPELSGYVTGAAIATYCPEHMGQIG